MPLLTSPIDGSPMRQIQRFGIELDVCPTSGGVWLDKGELEKLMALMKQAAEEEASMFEANEQRYDRSEQPRYRDEEPRYRDDSYNKPRYDDRDAYRHGKHHRKKGKLHQMMELFDF